MFFHIVKTSNSMLWIFFLTAECYKLLTSSISTSRYIISLIFWADKTKYQYSPNQRNKENNPQQFIMQYSNWQMIKATNVQQAGFRVGYKHRMEFTHYTAMGRYTHIKYMYIGQLKSDKNFILVFSSYGINSNLQYKSLGKQEVYI